MNLHITCSTDTNYLQHCTAMLCSVLENNTRHQITIHLLHCQLPKHSQRFLAEMCNRYNQKILFYNVDERELNSVHFTHKDLSIATYYRLLLPSLLDKSIDKILYLDCDVIVLQDISELFKIDISNYGIAAIKDSAPISNEHRLLIGLELDGKYFCAGVLLINMRYWRKHKSSEVMFNFLNQHSKDLFFEDQDVLNYVFRNHWFQLPNKYGKAPLTMAVIDEYQKTFDYMEYALNASIIHYATHIKPWLDIRIPNDHYYWKYVKLSKFPNPQKTPVSSINKRRIINTKIRYYINWYIRPWLPHLLELIIIDILDMFFLFTHILRPKTFRYYHLKRFLKKYDKFI